MTPNGHLDPNLPLDGRLGPTGAAAPAPRLSLQPDPVLVALGSRKSSVMSLGRVSYDQRSLVSSSGCSGCVLPAGCVLRGPGRSIWQSSFRLVPRLRAADALAASG